MANSARAMGKPALNDQCSTGQQYAENHRVPGMPRPAEIRFIGDEGQDGDNHAHCYNEAVLLVKPAGKYDGRQGPYEQPCGPVERPREFRWSPSDTPPPLPTQVQRPKLEVDGQVDDEPE